jgi:hypothetical protein
MVVLRVLAISKALAVVYLAVAVLWEDLILTYTNVLRLLLCQ